MTDPLLSELNEHELFREKLKAEFPDENDETLGDTLEGLTNLHERIEGVLRSELEDRALAKGLTGRINEMIERFERFEIRANKKRELCLDAMERANIKKISAPDFTASLRNVPQSVRIVDETKIPTTFFEPQPDKLSKRQLLQALKDGLITEGATLNNPPRTISIRTK